MDSTCLFHKLKIWADHYACDDEAKGLTVPLLFKYFVVTSNYSIDDLFAAHSKVDRDALKRRFKVHELLKGFPFPSLPLDNLNVLEMNYTAYKSATTPSGGLASGECLPTHVI